MPETRAFAEWHEQSWLLLRGSVTRSDELGSYHNKSLFSPSRVDRMSLDSGVPVCEPCGCECVLLPCVQYMLLCVCEPWLCMCEPCVFVYGTCYWNKGIGVGSRGGTRENPLEMRALLITICVLLSFSTLPSLFPPFPSLSIFLPLNLYFILAPSF